MHNFKDIKHSSRYEKIFDENIFIDLTVIQDNLFSRILSTLEPIDVTHLSLSCRSIYLKCNRNDIWDIFYLKLIKNKDKKVPLFSRKAFIRDCERIYRNATKHHQHYIKKQIKRKKTIANINELYLLTIRRNHEICWKILAELIHEKAPKGQSIKKAPAYELQFQSWIQTKSWLKYNLQSLNLSHLNLTTLPDPIYHLSSLKILNLSKNRLQFIDEKIKNLKKLRILQLAYNCLKKLPNSLSTLHKLKTLSIDNNRLKKIQSDLFYLPTLEYLQLSKNQLSFDLLNEINNHSKKVKIKVTDSKYDQILMIEDKTPSTL